MCNQIHVMPIPVNIRAISDLINEIRKILIFVDKEVQLIGVSKRTPVQPLTVFRFDSSEELPDLG